MKSALPPTLSIVSPLPQSIQALRIQGFRANEALSQPFDISLFLQIPERLRDRKELESVLHGLLDKPICLSLQSKGAGEPRYFHGRLSSVELAESTASLHLRPWLSRLDLNNAYRFFQNKTTVEIATWLFDQAEIPANWYRIQLLSSNKPRRRELCTQFAETNLQFLTRLLEEDGISYFFEHNPNGHTLVLTDRGYADPQPTPALVKVGGGLAHTGADHIYFLRQRVAQFPGAVAIGGPQGNRGQPCAPVQSPTPEAPSAQAGSARCSVFEYQDSYDEESVCRAYAEVRHQELQTQALECSGASNIRSLRPGARFSVSQSRKTHLVTTVSHTLVPEQGAETGTYLNSFTSLPEGVNYRPARRTPVPKVPGPQIGLVLGPNGETTPQAQRLNPLDKRGRLQVLFQWDTDAKNRSPIQSKCWVPLAHSWGGQNRGVWQVPQVGQEVIVFFRNGDPDLPIIMGCFPSQDKPFPPVPGSCDRVSAIRFPSEPASSESYSELGVDYSKGSERLYAKSHGDLDLILERELRLCAESQRSKLRENWELNSGSNVCMTAKDGIYLNADGTMVISAKSRICLQVGESRIDLLPDKISIKSPAIDLNCSDAPAAPKALKPEEFKPARLPTEA